jgi:hypothetical protein
LQLIEQEAMPHASCPGILSLEVVAEKILSLWEAERELNDEGPRQQRDEDQKANVSDSMNGLRSVAGEKPIDDDMIR